MLKSALLVSILALTLRSTKAIWALMFVCSLASAATMHLMMHDHVGLTKALLYLASLDTLGSVAYVFAVAIFG